MGRPPTDWNEIYLALASSPLHDPRFYADSFGRQPVKHCFKALEFAAELERERTNAQSITTARLAQVVQVAASMGKARGKVTDFLPYELKRRSDSRRISIEAAATIRQLIKQREIPLHIATFIAEDLKNPTSMN